MSGDPTEGALLTLALKAGVNPSERVLARPRLAQISGLGLAVLLVLEVEKGLLRRWRGHLD